MRKIFAAWAVLLALVSSTNAVAPSKSEVITSFEPVVVDYIPVIVDRGFPSPTLAPRPKENVVSKPIIVNLTPPPPVVHNETPTVAAAREYAKSRLGSTQYSCIDKIFEHESGWNPYDLNPTSGAYGIPQAVPGSKMAVIADDWRTNPVTQVKWGIRYVNRRYGSACNAWAFWLDHRWY